MHLIGEEIAISWNDGTESYLPLELLRRACPCASCGGEPDVLGNMIAAERELHGAEFRAAGLGPGGRLCGAADVGGWPWHRDLFLSIFATPERGGLTRLLGSCLFPMSRFAKATLLLFFFSLCGAAFFITARVREHAPTPAPHELFAIVNEQLAAFRADDFPSAYRQATSGVQQKFTLPQFEAMVRRNYGEIATPAGGIWFGAGGRKHGAGGGFFLARDGSTRVFLYSLISEAGGWKIGGVEEINRCRPSRAPAGSTFSAVPAPVVTRRSVVSGASGWRLAVRRARRARERNRRAQHPRPAPRRGRRDRRQSRRCPGSNLARLAASFHFSTRRADRDERFAVARRVRS